MTRNKVLIVLFACLLFTHVSVAEPAKAESIRQLMRLTGAGELGKQVFQQMLPALKNMAPDAPPAFWDDIVEEINVSEMEEMVVPIYQKYLSEEDIQAINAFYGTPAGKKLIQVQPSIIQESMLAGQQWGQNLAMEVMRKYQESTEN